MNPLHNKERLSLPEAKIAVSGDPPIGPAELGRLQRETFAYFVKEANPSNGLIADKTQPGAPPSIAAVGLGLVVVPRRRRTRFDDVPAHSIRFAAWPGARRTRAGDRLGRVNDEPS